MEEMNGFDIAVKVLGERIAQLESDVRYERLMKEEAAKKVEALANENARLVTMLDNVHQYIEKMEE